MADEDRRGSLEENTTAENVDQVQATEEKTEKNEETAATETSSENQTQNEETKTLESSDSSKDVEKDISETLGEVAENLEDVNSKQAASEPISESKTSEESSKTSEVTEDSPPAAAEAIETIETADEAPKAENEEEEYEDAHSGEEDEERELGEEEEDVEEEEEGVVVEGEREEGDGEEEGAPVEKPLDHDQDRRNPQYIPKRGMFYEHDDRTAEEVAQEKAAEAASPEAATAANRKKSSRTDVDRWTHDLFDAEEQGPKSDGELKGQYGYDIRKEEGAPRARRRRRYGRGPNKYDRSWEDEQAYSKPSPRGRGGRPRGGGGRGRGNPTSPVNDAPGPRSDSRTRDNDKAGGFISFRRGGGGRTYEERPKAIRGRGENMTEGGTPPRDEQAQDRQANSNRGPPKNQNPYRGGSRFITEPAGNSSAHPVQKSGGGNVGGIEGGAPESRGRGRGRGQPPQPQPHQSWRREEESQPIGGLQRRHTEDNNQSASANAARSKRYSSQRQRMTTPPPAPAAANHLPQPLHFPYASYPEAQPPTFPPMPPLVAHHSPVMGFAGAPAAPPPPIYQGYPAAAPPALPVAVSLGSPQSQDVYGTGIMYYNTDHQFVRPPVHAAQPPLRRPNAAIPIVAPTDGKMESAD